MDVSLFSIAHPLTHRYANETQADDTGSVDSFEAVGFKTVKHQRIADDEMPDVLYSIQYCSSTGRLMESECHTNIYSNCQERELTHNSPGELKAPRSQSL